MDEKQIKSKISEGYIHSRIILEVVGKPKEYVVETLKENLKKIKDDKNNLLISEKTEKPAKQDNYFSTFAEIEVLSKDSLSLLSLCFDYMPSSVEIIEPEKITLSSFDFSGFLNDMQARLHAVNTGVIELSEKNLFYIKNTAVLLRNFIVVLLSSKPMSVEKMQLYLGISKEDIDKVLGVLIKEGKVKKEGAMYFAVEKNE